MEAKSCPLDGKTFCNPNDKSLKTIIARPGGKTKLLPKIMPLVPKHSLYIEPFVGGGAVALKKPLSKKTII